MATLVHRPGFRGPPCPRPGCCRHHEPTGFGPELDVVRKAGFIKKDLRHSNAARIADADDPCFRGHVITV
jgi:hypothetical protein